MYVLFCDIWVQSNIQYTDSEFLSFKYILVYLVQVANFEFYPEFQNAIETDLSVIRETGKSHTYVQ